MIDLDEDAAPDAHLYFEAIYIKPWMTQVWQMRKYIQLIGQILSGEGLVFVGSGSIEVSDAYRNIQQNGALGMLVSRLKIQTIPSISLSGRISSQYDLHEYMENYKALNQEMIELLEGNIEG